MKIAYLTPNAPLPADRGGRVRAHHLWRALEAFGDVKVIVLGDTPPRREREMLWRGGHWILPRRRIKASRFGGAASFREGIDPPGLWEIGGQLAAWAPDPRFWHGLSRADAFHRHHLNERRIARIVARLAAWRPDAVVLCDTGLAPLLPAMRTLGCKVIVGPHNLDSRLYADIVAHATDPAVARVSDLIRRSFDFMERSYLPLADQVWACSAVDAQRFRNEFGLRDVRVVPNAIDVASRAPDASGRDLVYIAQMGYRPNEEAAMELIAMSRRLGARGVQHRLHLVGRSTEAIRRAAAGVPGVHVVGAVPSTAPWLALAAVVPVPLRVGGGTRIKIVEAMGAGKPVVSTAIGIEGIEARHGIEAMIVDEPQDFDDAVVQLLDNPDEARRIGAAGHALALARYSNQAVTADVAEALGALGLQARPAAARAARRARVLAKQGRFNALTRLLVLKVLVSADRPIDWVECELSEPAGAVLYNAGTSLGWTTFQGRPVQQVEVTAVLPPEVAPSQLRVRGQAWGDELFTTDGDGAEIVTEACGLLTVDLDGTGRLSGSAWWSDAPGQAPAVRYDGRLDASMEEAPTRTGQGIAVADFQLALPDPAGRVRRLEVLPAQDGAEVDGQIFWLIDAFRQPKAPTSRRLSALRDRHRGETAWIIGNGPSVRTEDLDRLQGRLTFAFNRFHMAHGQTRLRPTYTLTGDRQMIEDFGQQIVDESGGTVFVADDTCPPLVGDFVWLRQIPVFPPLFSLAPDRWVSPGGSSLYAAMQVAHFMGIRRFYVYGADFKFVYERARNADPFRIATGDDNHFIKNYRNNRAWCPPSFRDICPAFLTARLMMERDGGWIRNATRGGLLEIFERADFDTAVDDA